MVLSAAQARKSARLARHRLEADGAGATAGGADRHHDGRERRAILAGDLATGETPVTEFMRARMKSAFKVLNGHLSDRSFVIGDDPTIADLSLCGYLF